MPPSCEVNLINNGFAFIETTPLIYLVFTPSLGKDHFNGITHKV